MGTPVTKLATKLMVVSISLRNVWNTIVRSVVGYGVVLVITRGEMGEGRVLLLGT